MRNYGDLVIKMSQTVPDGIVVFFPSYLYMESIIMKWDEMGVLQRILENKLLLIETRDLQQTILALEDYWKACDCGWGAVFLSIARGKVAEGVDFMHHYGRCVIVIGIPYQYTLSISLKQRLEYMEANYSLKSSDFLTFDAMWQTA